ncbi:MAG: hypothetical protein ACP5IT_11465 [Thermoproteota archaeon]
MSEELSEKANILWGKYDAKVKYKNNLFKTIIVANVVSVQDFLRTLRGIFMHAKVALDRKRDEPITLLNVEPKLVLFTIAKPTISVANRENRFIYYDSKNFLAYTEKKDFAKVQNKDMLLNEISEVFNLAPERGQLFIDLDEKKISRERIVRKKDDKTL